MDLYYFDESGFSQKSNLPYAWSPVGEPFAFPAYSHSKRLNVLGFLSRQGKLVYHSTEGHVTTDTVIEAFEKLIENKPHTAKKKLTVVFLDNASFHRSAKFKEKCSDWITEGVLVLYLPAYSPELNGIWDIHNFVITKMAVHNKEMAAVCRRCYDCCQISLNPP